MICLHPKLTFCIGPLINLLVTNGHGTEYGTFNLTPTWKLTKTTKTDIFSSWRRDVVTPWRLLPHGTIRLFHVCTTFEANHSKKTATVAPQPPTWTFLRHNVANLLCHDVFSTRYDAPITYPCLYQIWSKSVKNTATVAQKPPKLRFLPRRRYVMTFFHMLRCTYTMSMFPPNMKKISR